jgi:putative membrane protein
MQEQGDSKAIARRSGIVRNLLIPWAILSIALGLVAALMDSVDISGGVFNTILVAALFGIVNVVIGPILYFLSMPLTFITLGLFALVVNGALLGITAGLSDVLSVGGFWSTIWAALLISLFSLLLGFVFRPRDIES